LTRCPVPILTVVHSCDADLIFLALQVILALGNRPKAEKLTYTISFLVFAFFSLYLIFMTVILTIKAFCVRLSLFLERNGSS
jgi:chitin synthase